MRDVLDDDLAELYPARGTDDVRLARLREQLFAEKPQPRSRRWIGIAAAAAAVVVIAGLVVFLRPAPFVEEPAEMPGAPATSLVEASNLIKMAKPRGKVRHVRYEIWETFTDRIDGVWHAAQLEFSVEVWLPVADGQKVRVERKPTGRQRALPGIPESPPVRLEAQYSGPPLWATNCPVTPCNETSLLYPVSRDPGETISSVSSAVLSPFTPNDRKAEVYRELATLDGVQWVDGSVFVSGGKASLRIDPATGEAVGYEVRETVPYNRMPIGTVLLSVSVARDWTDQRPS
ncbi:hypothetical protein [Lentzea sp. NBRC 102530]|uniref:hypothetical protein n=1 Tax=Lentzea sp. NBRC 102530 TaxID=3032201 RepID=UPI00249FFBAA|nr:hypothetical protein [Lentzea sp. NBRC 102530]GLY54205.1 hypothetical protein Lesp01_78610 [Lentzea sp. NBRC 102530]